MAEETEVANLPTRSLRKRKNGQKTVGKSKKRIKPFPGMGKKKAKVDKRMKQLYRKRAKEYNSDDEDDDSAPGARDENVNGENYEVNLDGDSSESEGEDDQDKVKLIEGSDDEDDEMEPGTVKFMDGIRAFRMAFHKIMNVHKKEEEALGPMLSSSKKLVVEKLAEEEAERKAKGTAKKEKRLFEEKGHVKPANFLDAHEKFLIGVATKGVVKLFNAVNKAKNAQKGSNPNRTKDAKVLRDRRKQAFFSELGKASAKTGNKASTSNSQSGNEEPAWAPLRDSYMLTNHKLKDWDKMADKSAVDTGMQSDSSDDDSDD